MLVLVLLVSLFAGCGEEFLKTGSSSLTSVPEFSGEPYVAVNGNVPYFTEDEITDQSFEEYAELDSLGRCGPAVASVGRDLMPTEERQSIGSVKPSGWQTVKYDCVDGKYLYNRCHLIGFQLSGENANRKNLITGTRYLNIEGMLPFENMTADYVKETGNHVMYRVTPVFQGNNLVADGVLMEGWSVEDEGEGICFCVFAYNAQPGIVIDYATGESFEDDQTGPADSDEMEYVINTSSGTFHTPDCPSVDKMKEKNKEYFTGSREELIAEGYTPCSRCKP